MATKFTPEARGALIERFAVGCTVADAANAAGLSEMTVKRWITRGRREKKGAHAEFFAAVEDAREQARNRPEPMDADELARVVSEAARKGNTQAMKLRDEQLLRAERKAEEPAAPADPLAELDELAQVRARRRD